jgi:hypothetical protein
MNLLEIPYLQHFFHHFGIQTTFAGMAYIFKEHSVKARTESDAGL